MSGALLESFSKVSDGACDVGLLAGCVNTSTDDALSKNPRKLGFIHFLQQKSSVDHRQAFSGASHDKAAHLLFERSRLSAESLH